MNVFPVNSAQWKKSSYSNGNGGQCVEVGAFPWRKSSYSNGGESNCAEAGHAPGAVLVRDTKDRGAGPVLRVSAEAWRRFTGAVRA